MTDYLDLALKYGGFTSLDKIYLENVLKDLTDDQKLTFITPPPSVINAYFAEIYEKDSPQAALDYYFELSKSLKLLTKKPSFDEKIPFVRLNLSGQSYGLAFEGESRIAQVFPEKAVQPSETLLFEIARLFPGYQVWLEAEQIKLGKQHFDASGFERMATDYLLTDVEQKADLTKISGFNLEEVMAAAATYQTQKYYAWSGRTAVIYVKN